MSLGTRHIPDKFIPGDIKQDVVTVWLYGSRIFIQ